MTTLIITLGVILSLIGLGLCLRFWLLPAAALGLGKKGAVAGVMGLKVTAAIVFVALPLGAVAVANYQTFEGVKDVDACASCHVMKAKADDMKDPESRTLAALHYKNRWIADQQCYNCHTDYGLAGGLKSKADGFRHLARYVTGTHDEPVTHRGYYDNNNCLKCHGETYKYQAVSSHTTIEKQLASSQSSCLNCHGLAHAGHAIPVQYGK